jgi:outer membrane protein TolC
MGFIRAGALFFILIVSLGAQEVLTLEGAIERGLEQSLSLKQARIDLDLAALGADNLWAQLFPGISLTGGLQYRNSLSAVQSQDPLSYTAGLNVSLNLKNDLPYAMRNISLAYETQLLGYEQARRQMELQITKTFFSLLASQAQLALLEEGQALAAAQQEKQQTAFNNGLASELALLRSRLAAQEARFALSQARAQYDAALGSFLALLGYGAGEELRLEGELVIREIHPDGEALIGEYLQKRPDIVLQRRRIASLENTGRMTMLNSRGPAITIGAGWNGGYGDSFRNGLPGDFSDSLTGSLTIGMSLDSWIPGSKGDQNVQNARGAVEKAVLELENMERSGMAEIRSYAANINNAWESIEIARLQAAIAQRTYELSEEGFRLGTVEFLDLETTRQDMVRARQQLLKAELDYRNMILDLAVLINIDWTRLD